MSLVSINDVLKITTRVEKIHPYKVVGNRDSYSPYNEGWSDCVSLIEHYLEQIPSVEPERTAKVIEHFITFTTEPPFSEIEYLCDACKKKVLNGDDYCSHCGARLEWK